TPCCHFMSTLTSCAPPRRPRLPYTTPFRSATLGRRRERLVRDAARVATLKEELERGRRAAVLAPQVPRAEAADRRVAAAHTALAARRGGEAQAAARIEAARAALGAARAEAS